jgi:hypothetical protein
MHPVVWILSIQTSVWKTWPDFHVSPSNLKYRHYKLRSLREKSVNCFIAELLKVYPWNLILAAYTKIYGKKFLFFSIQVQHKPYLTQSSNRTLSIFLKKLFIVKKFGTRNKTIKQEL